MNLFRLCILVRPFLLVPLLLLLILEYLENLVLHVVQD